MNKYVAFKDRAHICGQLHELTAGQVLVLHADKTVTMESMDLLDIFEAETLEVAQGILDKLCDDWTPDTDA